jgi:hypothetical protein
MGYIIKKNTLIHLVKNLQDINECTSLFLCTQNPEIKRGK